MSHATTANTRRSCTRHRLSRWRAKFVDTSASASVIHIRRGDFQSVSGGQLISQRVLDGVVESQCVRSQELPPCTCTPQSADEAISQSFCKMGIELAGPCQTAQFSHVGCDRFFCTLIPVVESISFSNHKWFHCEMSFESRAEFRKRLVSWGVLHSSSTQLVEYYRVE